MQGYLDALQSIEASGRSAAPGNPEEDAGIEGFRELFSDFSPERIRALARRVYADDVFFNDTLKEIRGVDALEPYLVESAEATVSCSADVRDVSRHDGNCYLRWVMEIRFNRFRKGELTRSIGMSHLRIDADGRILLHQDYWDAAGGLFEHVPLVGYGIRAIKARL